MKYVMQIKYRSFCVIDTLLSYIQLRLYDVDLHVFSLYFCKFLLIYTYIYIYKIKR